MISRRRMSLLIGLIWACAAHSTAAPGLAPDDSPAKPGEWGFRPADGSTVEANPPAFAWRPQKGAVTYFLECASNADFSKDVYRIEKLWLNVHCPPRTLAPGTHYWRYGYADAQGQRSQWSQVRSFRVPADATKFPMPPMAELIARIPTQHPRLFVRPEELDQIRRDIKGPLRERWEQLVKEAERLVANPPPSDEPLKYEPGWKFGDPQWLERWWGNREKVIRTLDGAATLAFVYMISGERKYGDVARRLMLDAAAWDPKGSTNHVYNDEASMPVLYLLSRAYTWGHAALSEEDRAKIRASMAERGREVFNHLRRSPHTWRPYDSHHNRAWHKLGELAIAFMGEIEEAPQWLEHTVNTFYCCYPVWSDDDGGWHEGASYWSAYQNKHTWWLDVMKSALGIDGYTKPFFRRSADFPMYVMPPGTRCGGLGDLALEMNPRGLGDTVAILARGAQNGYWQWYADQVGGTIGRGCLGLLRSRQGAPKPKAPDDLPQSKLFRGTGLAMLHTNLRDATRDVQMFFKSSPMGSQSHGFNAQNSYILAVHGKPVLIWTGRRDWHGSPHHTRWMWETKSQNCILVNGQGQIKHRTDVGGRITAFHTGSDFDYVVGDASEVYGDALKKFTRTILFAKPDVILIYDQLAASEPSSFSWLLHAPEKMEFADQSAIVASNGDSHARVSILEPRGLRVSQNDRFDPLPQKWPGWRQWHLSAETLDRRDTLRFITVIRPYAGTLSVTGETARQVKHGWYCDVQTNDGGKLHVLLHEGAAGQRVSSDAAFWTDGDCTAVRLDATGKGIATFSANGSASYAGQAIERVDCTPSPNGTDGR